MIFNNYNFDFLAAVYMGKFIRYGLYMKNTQNKTTLRSSSNNEDDYGEPIEEHMSRAEWLADVEVAVTSATPDPLEVTTAGEETQDDNEVADPNDDGADLLREANEIERARIWAAWKKKFGPAEASRRWLLIFAATDAPRTG